MMWSSMLIVVAWTLAAAPEPSEPPSFESTIAQAQRLWEKGDNQAVADLFEQAHRREPRAEYLFGQARAEAAMGHCTRALALLDTLEASDPPPPIRDAVRGVRAECAHASPEPPGPEEPAEVEPVVGDEPEPEPEPPTRAEPPRWRRDSLGWGLVGGGGLVAVAGGGLWIGAARQLAHPPFTVDEDGFAVDVTRWQGVGRAGIAVTSVGVTLALAGIIRLVVVARRHR